MTHKRFTLTKSIINALPKLKATDGTDALVLLKLFNPAGSGTWYLTEASVFLLDERELSLAEAHAEGITLDDPRIDDIHGFSLCCIQEAELGNVSFNELREYEGRFGLGIERDIYWKALLLSEVQKQEAGR